MKKGLSTIGVVVIVIIAILAILIGWWQYRMYTQRKAIEKIEDQIMNNASLE